jgi:hypothetical protein
MKALELKVYPEWRGYYREDDGSPLANQLAADSYSRAKRFSGAEMAAEYHAWDAHLKHLQWCELSSGDELSEESWRKLNARLETLWWFASLPHFDEAAS